MQCSSRCSSNSRNDGRNHGERGEGEGRETPTRICTHPPCVLPWTACVPWGSRRNLSEALDSHRPRRFACSAAVRPKAVFVHRQCEAFRSDAMNISADTNDDELSSALKRIEALLVRQVDACEQMLDLARTRRGQMRSDDSRVLEHLLPAISAAIGDLTFRLADLCGQLAQGDAELALTMRTAIGAQVDRRRLGKLFARGANHAVNGCVLERVGLSRGAAQWRVRRVSNPSETYKPSRDC